MITNFGDSVTEVAYRLREARLSIRSSACKDSKTTHRIS